MRISHKKINYLYILFVSCIIAISMLPPTNLYGLKEMTYIGVIVNATFLFMLLILLTVIKSKEKIKNNVVFSVIILAFFTIYNFIVVDILDFVHLTLFIIFPLLFGLVYVNQRFDVNKILVSVLLISIVQTAIAIVMQNNMEIQLFFYEPGRDLFRPMLAENVLRAVGLIGHPIPLAIISGVGIIISVHFMSLKEKRYLNFLIIIFLSYGLYLTYSRSAWISILIVIIVWWLKQNLKVINKNLRNFEYSINTLLLSWLLFFVVPIVVSFVISNTNIVSRFLDLFNGTGSVSHRILMIEWTIDRILSNDVNLVIGNGFGSYELLPLEFIPSDGFPIVDNSILSMFIDFGVISLVLSSLFLVFLILALIKSNNTNYGVLLIVLYIFLVSLTFDIWKWNSITVIFFFFLGMMFEQKKMESVVNND